MASCGFYEFSYDCLPLIKHVNVDEWTNVLAIVNGNVLPVNVAEADEEAGY